ncbi:peptidoglycan-binding protein, partial [Blautia sp.]|uniref:peptidoglycan-binding protein n=1 Tax=Blautia sp. TaxID=1955243 RepID=UPI003D9270C0
KTFGTEKALEHFCMTRQTYKGYHCFSTYQAFERKGRTSSRPQIGALIVFTYEHIGRVTAVRNGRVYTNEGNTSALYGDRNGGTVKEKSYALNDPNIKGYCLIDYDGETEVPGAETAIPFGQIRVFQNWLNTWYGNLLKRECGAVLEADGRFGPRTRQAALVVWKDILNRLYGKKIPLSGERFDEKCKEAAGTALVRYGSKGTFVVLAEGFLAEQGIYLGNIDGIFGTGMEEAVRRFQTDYLLETDGVIGRNTWTGLFAI